MSASTELESDWGWIAALGGDFPHWLVHIYEEGSVFQYMLLLEWRMCEASFSLLSSPKVSCQRRKGNQTHGKPHWTTA